MSKSSAPGYAMSGILAPDICNVCRATDGRLGDFLQCSSEHSIANDVYALAHLCLVSVTGLFGVTEPSLQWCSDGSVARQFALVISSTLFTAIRAAH